MIKPTSKYNVNSNSLVKFATNMTKKGVFLPIILLEGTVVAGRTYQAYKRGGITEARERVIEETTGSFVWLGGAPLLGLFGNWIGKKFAGIKNTNFDIGKDAVRNPLQNVLKTTKNATMGRYAGFKFTNTLASIILASSFLGFVVPKINQRITNKMDKAKHSKTLQEKTQNQQNTIKANQKQNKDINFKGLISPQQIATLTHNLENNAVYKLLSTDTGVFVGRAANARNKDERREILFRDIVSSFFYLLASPLVVKGLKAADNKIIKGNSNIDAYSAGKIHNYLVNNMPKEKMTPEEFQKFALGDFDKKSFEKLTFDKDGIISLTDFKKAISDTKLQEKAAKMSKMQPLKDNIAILTKQQVQDVLTDGKITNPELLKDVLNNILGPLGTKEDILANPNKFIPQKEIEGHVSDIKAYAGSIIEYAKKHNIKEITPETLLKANKRNLNRNLGFMIAGFATAAAFLSTIIPKVQYYITKMKTGSDSFPGAKDLQETKMKQKIA